ncbi:MAG: homoprotocatechuate degradation operon regulator HpaR [Rhodobacteraceae bacterium]|nr:homoprotocatechuate degradation operon regulator HpaR [Paracoccaceae bacterium]
MSSRIDTVERSLAIMLLKARETVMQRFRPMLKQHGLSEQQWRVLRVLNEQGASEPTNLAREAVILMPSLTRILAALEERQLISRSRHPGDGRRQIARLTDNGQHVIAEITPASIAIYAGLEQDFGAEDTHQLMQALRRLARLQTPQ